ncbi:MAG: hypothetical protein Wins2KO_26920 [Winogradskyella sp.]
MKNLYLSLCAIALSLNCLYSQTEVIENVNLGPIELVVYGNDLYIANTYDNKVQKIDMTSPSPTLIDVATNIGGAAGLAIRGDELFVSGYNDTNIYKLDLTLPVPITPTVIFSDTSCPYGLEVKGDDLYVAEIDCNSIFKIDVTDPEPSAVTVVETGLDGPTSLAIKNDILYITQQGSNKISTAYLKANLPTTVSDVVTGLNGPFASYLKGDYLYFSEGGANENSGTNKISKFNTNDISPTVTVIYSNLTDPTGFALNGDEMYFSDYWNGKIFRFDTNIPFRTAGSGDWNSSLTWTGGSIPTSTEGVQINHNITMSSGVVHNDNITISSGSITIEKQASLTINGTLTTNNSVILDSDSDEYSSLIATTVVGEIAYQRAINAYTNDAVLNDNDLVSSPVGTIAFSDLANHLDNTNLLASGSLRAFAPFDKTANPAAYVNFDVNNADNIILGRGYRAATTDGGTITFEGTPVTSAVSYNITDSGNGYEEWNLIGNPYPSFIDASLFLNHEVSPGVTNASLLDNNAIGIYGYDGNTSDGWEVITLANASGKHIAPGQGFFVAADGDDVVAHDIEFTPAMRLTSAADDFIAGRHGENATNGSTLTFVKLKINNTSANFITDIYFDDNCSLGLDPGYDAMIWGGTAPSNFSIYTHLVEDNTGVDIALQAVGSNDINDVIIPVGVNASASSQLTFSIDEMNNISSTVEIYLDDTVSGISTLLNDGDYVFTPSSNLAGTGRFYLRFTNTTLSLTEDILEHLQIVSNHREKTIDIIGNLQPEITATLFDIQGRIILSTVLNSRTLKQSIAVDTINPGVYVVQLNHSNQNKTQKVIIN